MPVADLALHTLHGAVAYAFERPALAGGTLHEAIAFGRPDLPRRTVEDAARAAQADHFVRCLPDGYDTPRASRRCPGDSSSASGWPAPWPARPCCTCWTTPRPAWTRRPRPW
ncbi:hypothetical protein [Kitasatospora paranensis]|uniref:hypothetical protein n=1 Tax=Kitasatospora paranensis TaxID=258053 RepID=UPI0031EA51EF